MKAIILCSVLITLSCYGLVQCCNEAICASLVTKCQLIKSCSCDMSDLRNCTCCNNCQLCLAQLYSECCSCVDMCPHPDPEDSILHTSSIGQIMDPIPELFNVLMEEEDYLKRWTTHRYPVYYDSLYTKSSNTITEIEHEYTDGGFDMSQYMKNCTVAFMSECMSMKRCRTSCKSMGAARYRWFQEEGCCQCIGDTCIDYGLNEAMCLNCKDDVEDEENSQETNNELDNEESIEQSAEHHRDGNIKDNKEHSTEHDKVRHKEHHKEHHHHHNKQEIEITNDEKTVEIENNDQV